MKYEKIKKQVASSIYTCIIRGSFSKDAYTILLENVLSDKPKPPREALKDAANYAYDIVMAWDIRCIGKLRDIFPDLFPPSLKIGNLICDMDENGDWVVEKA